MVFRIAYNFLAPDDLWGSKVKVKPQKILKSNILRTVRDIEMVSIEVK